ncbi:MAG: hypothetical protein SFU25_07865 [Candidatus Caenarcaniphilales bacterium]|nr:hypothetical protein [Candidatus Caenarcaniphilales bacterium]
MKKLLFTLLLLAFPFYCFADEINLNDNTVTNSSGAGQEIVQFNHVFWIKILDSISQTDYSVKPEELVKGMVSYGSPHIKILGNLMLRSPNSAEVCMVRLPASSIKARNNLTGKEITLNLRGTIGGKTLSTEFVTPEFDQALVVPFQIEGYIDPTSMARGLEPGQYDYENALKLIVEFRN